MLKLNRGDQAKNCFLEALTLDVKCYDAFEQLISGEMLTPEEGTLVTDLSTPFPRSLVLSEWEFVQGLAYASQTPQDAAFVQLIYTARLRKYKHVSEHALTRQRLVEEFGLGDNPDVLFSFADALYAGFRWTDCYAITSRYVCFSHLSTVPTTHYTI
jgi:anaphase-promoting complex subunit 6